LDFVRFLVFSSLQVHDVSGVTADRKYDLKGISAALMALTCAELFVIDRGSLLHQSLAALEIRY
jgi:hypothetical protein